MVAESTTGSMLSIQTSSNPPGEGQSVVPEDLGKQAAEMLLEEIYRVRNNFKYLLQHQMQGCALRIIIGSPQGAHRENLECPALSLLSLKEKS